MALEFYSSIDLNKNELQNAAVHNLGTAPANPVEGQLYYDTTGGDKEVYVWNGSGWISMSGGGGDITSVVAGAGMTGGSTTGEATLNVIGGNGITANANDVAITPAQTTITSIFATDLIIGEDAQTAIDFGTPNEIDFKINNATELTLSATALYPVSDAGLDLGTSSLEFKDAFFDGTVTSDAFAGPLTGNVTGNADTATTLATTRAINGVNFNGSAAITVTAAAGTLSGNTLKSSVVASSLTSVGTIATGVWNGTAIASAYLDADTAHLTTAQTFTGSKTFGTTTKLNFRDANAYINSPTANDIEVAATTITLDAASDIQLEGNTTVTGNFSVSGTLNVDGTTTTIDSTTVAIADSMLKLAKDQANTADAVDFGFYGQYGVGGTAKYAGVFRDVSANGDPFVFFDGLQAEPGTTVNTGGTGYDLAPISAGRITAADGFYGDVTGDLTGQADTVATIAGLAPNTATTQATQGSITSAANLATIGTITTGVWNGTAIAAAYLAQATATAKGAVELATAAEVLTGTDTARVVTADTLSAKSVVATIAQSSLTDTNTVTITHNLGTADVMVQLFDMTTEANVHADIARTTDDMATASTSVISIDFGAAPPNDVRCLITSLKGATAAGTIAYT
tara:strand:- start:2971 stop:4857 length:1887 start_codon:yes stop_codon:yes gene_type:complete